MKLDWRRLPALMLCAALLCGTAFAEALPDAPMAVDEAFCAPVEAPVEEAPDMELGAWDDALPGADDDGEQIVEAAPVDDLPEYGVGAWIGDTGLVVEDAEYAPEDGAFEYAVSAGEEPGGSIGETAYWTLDADGLLTVSGEGAVTNAPWAAYWDAGVRRVVVCEGITALPDYAFYRCAALTEAQLPSTLEEISTGCFLGCESLERVAIAGGTAIGEAAFHSCTALTGVTLPESLTTVGKSAFYGCTALTGIALPASVTTVEGDAFYLCGALTSAPLPAGLVGLGDRAFYGTALTQVTLPGSLEAVGESAFQNAPVTGLTVEDGVKQIGSHAFAGTKLTGLALPDSVRSVGNGAFSGVPLEALEPGNGLTEIDGYAFYRTALKRVVLPDSLESLGSFAFCGSALEEITLGKGLKKIGDGALAQTSLARVRVPATVREVGENAFYAESLHTVVFEGTPKLGDRLFMNYFDTFQEVTFLGGVPEFAENTFADSNVVALYPGSDKAWTKEVRQQYGGTVTWVNSDGKAVAADKRAKTEKLKAEKYDYGNVRLVDNGDGTNTRVIPTNSGVAVEIYKSNTGKLLWKRTLKLELEYFGGFYSGKKYNFLVFGQRNIEENDKREVVRVVRYTKNWNRVDAAKVKGANTVSPFGYGDLSMAESGSMLYLHTCHAMYKSSDGYNHQANLDIDIYVPSMKATVVKGKVDNFGSGYVSHSFDQYIIQDGDDVIQLDLGDAYPRAVAMYRRKGLAGSAVKSGTYGEGLQVMKIAGTIGNNYTGVSLAGLEATKKYYITAGVSVSQKGDNPSGPQNVFVAAVPKDNFTEQGVKLRWLTSYKAGDGVELSKPKLVKLSNSSLLLLWTENRERTGYVFLKSSGKAASPVYKSVNMVTSGRPVVSGNQVRWLYNDGKSFLLAGIAADDTLHAPELQSFTNTAKGIKLKWGKVSGVTGYKVYRRTTGKTWEKLATVKGKTSYVDKTAKGGKEYYYTVRAYKGKTLSGYNTGKPILRLLAPTNVKVTREWGELIVSWKKVTGAAGYWVYRKIGSGKWKLAARVDAPTTSFDDWNLKSGKKYSYKVVAVSGTTRSAESAATKPKKP